MTTFRNDDIVSLQLIFIAFFAAIILLVLTYIFLKFFQRKMINSGAKPQEHLINVLETKYVPNLGYLCLVSVNNKEFLALNSKLGIKMLQIKDDSEILCKTESEEGEH